MDTKDKNRSAGQPRNTAARASTSRPRPQNRSAVATKTKSRRVAAPKKPTPDVVYTQPDPFNRNRFILRLVTVVAVVLALIFGMSIFFKVKTVTVAGTNKYTAWDVREASGIQEGENLLSISEPRISSNIRSALPYVNSVRVGIKLPDTVRIEIVELDVVYAIEGDDGSWWLMRADGGIVEKTNSADAGQHTKVLGVRVTQPKIGEQATAAQPQPQTDDNGETVPVTVQASQQLSTAVSILQYMEENGIIGEAASVDVANLENLQLWYGDRFQVILGDATQLSYKIGLVKNAIDQHMEDYDTGILDASLTIQPDPEKEYQVIYTPFNNEN